MSTQGKTVNARSDKSTASRLANKAVSAQGAAPSQSAARKRLRQRKYQELIRKHLSQVLDRLFAEFTRLHFRIVWTMALTGGQKVSTLPSDCSVCCKLSGSPLLPECRHCGPRHLAATLAATRGHSFTCRLGVRNYWVPIRVRSETLGVAYLQALEHSPRATRALPRRHGAVMVSQLEFARAARFLQLIVQYVQTATLSDLRKADLSSAGRAIAALDREQALLRHILHRYPSTAPQVPRSSGLETRGQQIVRSLLQRIESDYPSPITLQRYARDLSMNASYLSALFSCTVGIPFKAYLSELRLQKAKGLLGNPAKTASEVAFAVGYSSEERFRCVFKKATGLCPRVWRETMQIAPRADSP